MIDIHNHFLFNLDDGSKNIEETKELIRISKNQGVKTIFFTPHVNSSVSYGTREDHENCFQKIKTFANSLEVDCHLGAEIYIPFRLPEIDFSKYRMGNKNILLVEFSLHNDTPILDHCHNLINQGYKIIIAHVERYLYLTLEDVQELKDMGVFLQVNSSSILNKRNRLVHKKALKYIKKGIVDFVASDSHNLTTRPPNLKLAFNKLKKMIGYEKSLDLVLNNQKKIFFIKN